MAAPQPIENPQRSYEVFEKKHYMECTTRCAAAADGAPGWPLVLQRELRTAGLLRRHEDRHLGSALHVMLFLKNLIRALRIFNGLRSCHGQRALLVYHYRHLGERERQEAQTLYQP